MIISFDIDDTLVSNLPEFEVESPTLFSNIYGPEKIRKGTINLFKTLESKGHIIWIYTTSYRSTFYLKKMFLAYGLRPKRFINEKINRKELDKANCKASKHAGLFGIDIHIDDSVGVAKEGERYGFKTIIISPSDSEWVEKVKKGIELVEVNLPYKFKQLLITLIGLKSPYGKQREMYGIGNLGDEIATDFDYYYTQFRAEYLEYGYVNAESIVQLDALDELFEKKSDEKDMEFWDGLDTYSEWERIRLMAILSSMNQSELGVIIKREEHLDESEKLMVQRIHIDLDRNI